MKRKVKSALRIAIKEAIRSKSIDYKHSAVVISSAGKIVYRRHNLSCFPPSLNSNLNHAEERAIRTAIRNSIEIDTLIVVRVTKTGMLAESKPCPLCTKTIRRNKIKNVFYSDGKTRTIKELVNDSAKVS